MDLFSDQHNSFKPLAERVRAQTLNDYVGQSHILGPEKPLRRAIENEQLHSMILWGPPGVGKTTLARLLANQSQSRFESISAVLSGVKDIREAVDKSKIAMAQGQRTILFVDEVHRFNKAQQDAFLPFVEDGTFIFIGATTENPSFELNNALLSRARVYRLKNLDEDDLKLLLNNALKKDSELAEFEVKFEQDCFQGLIRCADGDGRRALGLLELLVDLAETEPPNVKRITTQLLAEAMGNSTRKFDKGGDVFYEQISALHKSVRGSAPDAALYWMCRMLDGGCDPFYIARRLIRMAVEDVCIADPRAAQVAMSAWDIQQRLGSPEGELALANAVLYLASAPKSNAAYNAYNQARSLVKSSPDYEVPMHLRNAPTELMKDVGMGDGYRYAHDEPEAYAAGEEYFPQELSGTRFYEPVDRGLESKIAQKLKYLRSLDQASALKRYPQES